MVAVPTLVVFLGGMEGSPVEEMVACAQRAAALDTIDSALSTGAFAGAVIATDRPQDLPDPVPAGLTVDADSEPFHFGRRLAGLVTSHSLESVVYLGGGSVPLLPAEGFYCLSRVLSQGEHVVVTNNPYSSDLVAINPANAITVLEPPETDNVLARALEMEAGLAVQVLPRTLYTLFDIDSPTDLAILSIVGAGGPRLRRVLSSLGLEVSRYRDVLPLLTSRKAQVMVAGRVGSHSWKYLERETACRVRVIAEERGMEADSRLVKGNVRSLLGLYLEEVGIEGLIKALPGLGDAAIIDTRVLLGHLGLDVGRRQRFLSDLGQPDDIQIPLLRDLTASALTASVPVLLGGHSLMSGGLMALNEFAWTARYEA